jgi:glucose-1-phosphate adenylyltransferase
MMRTLTFVLAGGEGRRLSPLTKERSKPAVYFGGRFRLIDFALSNLVNSGFHQIKVLTQYRSTSLLRHLSRAWPVFSTLGDQFIEAVPAAMNHGPSWYRGTADAIWQNVDVIRDARPHHVVIFGSDHVYKMDVSLMLEQHIATEAHLTVAALPVPRSQGSAFGCLQVDAEGRVTSFVEKPADPPPMPGNPELTLVSMGNYIFRTPALLDELRSSAARSTTHDFGKDILATAFERHDVYAYDFRAQLCPGESEHSRGYWRDVGTVDSYFEASMDLVSVHPHLDLYNQQWPIRGAQPLCGPAKFVFGDADVGRVGTAIDSIVGAGTIISGGRLEKSVCFHEVRLNSFCHVSESVLFPDVEIGRGARLRRCIVDRGVKIPPGTQIGFDADADARRFDVSDQGVVVVTRAHLGQVDEYDVDVDAAPRLAVPPRNAVMKPVRAPARAPLPALMHGRSPTG